MERISQISPDLKKHRAATLFSMAEGNEKPPWAGPKGRASRSGRVDNELPREKAARSLEHCLLPKIIALKVYWRGKQHLLVFVDSFLLILK